MAITTYTELKTAVENWLAHTNYTARIPEFIVLFEAVANRKLRVRQMEISTNLTPSSGLATLPTDYLSYRRVTWTGSTRIDLDYVTPSYLQTGYPTASSGTPNVFTIEGSTLKVRPSNDTVLEFDYYQKIPPLATNDPNWLLTAHPDLYLFGTLTEAQMFGEDDERFMLWKSRRDEIIEEISQLANRSRGAGMIRQIGATP